MVYTEAKADALWLQCRKEDPSSCDGVVNTDQRPGGQAAVLPNGTARGGLASDLAGQVTHGAGGGWGESIQWERRVLPPFLYPPLHWVRTLGPSQPL